MEFTYRIVGARQSSDCVDFQFFVVLEPSDIEGHLEKLNCLMTFTSVVIRQSEIIKDTCLSAPIVFSFKESQCNSEQADRKSTRLNSSHGYISYAVFCLKKKKKKNKINNIIK